MPYISNTISHKSKDVETLIIPCECGDYQHQTIIQYVKTKLEKDEEFDCCDFACPDISFSTSLVCHKSFFDRLKTAVKYLFLQHNKEWFYDSTILGNQNLQAIINICQRAKTNFDEYDLFIN